MSFIARISDAATWVAQEFRDVWSALRALKALQVQQVGLGRRSADGGKS
jgi:hypothetical protein